MKKRIRENFDADTVCMALTHNVSYIGSDEGYNMWSDIIDTVRLWKETRGIYREHRIQNNPLICLDRPDLYINGDDYILGIECFEFDSTKNTRKGSSLNRKEEDALRKIDEYHKETGKTYLTERVQLDLQYEYYKDSIRKTYQNHANKLDEYYLHLDSIEPNKSKIIAFFMKDSTVFGNYIQLSDGSEKPLCALETNDFLQLILQDNNRPNYIITYNQIDYYLYKTVIMETSDDVITKQIESISTEENLSIAKYDYKIINSFGQTEDL